MNWKKGRGRLGVFSPLLGKWIAHADSEMGEIVCVREFNKILDGKYIELNAHWKSETYSYDELAMLGVDATKQVRFWSFTSDGKQSSGWLADCTDIHPDAIGMEAEMPSGLARQVYWPDDEGIGFFWVVESKTKKGWNRFVEHHYLPFDDLNG